MNTAEEPLQARDKSQACQASLHRFLFCLRKPLTNWRMEASLVDFCTLWFLRLNSMSENIPSAASPVVLSSATPMSKCFSSDFCPVSGRDLGYQVMAVTIPTCSGFVIPSEISSAKLVMIDPSCLHVVGC